MRSLSTQSTSPSSLVRKSLATSAIGLPIARRGATGYPPAQRPVTTIVYVALAVKPTSGNEPVKVTSWVPDGSGVSIT